MAEDWRAASIERVLYKAEFTVMGILVVGLLGLLLLVLGTLFAVYLGIRLFQGKPTPRNAWHAIPGECPTCGVEVARDAPDGLCPRCLLRQAIVEPAALRSGSTPATGAYPAAFGPSAVEQRPLHFPTTPPTGPYQGTFGAPDIGQLAEHFPNLEILDLLGQGGMGAVYKARQTKLDRLVALKILPPEAGRDVAFAERFTREAQALARLGHPNIVGIYDFGEAGGFFYVVMEYVDGPNLRQLLRTGRMDSAQVFRIVSQLCDALQYAHDEGIVHRDIKPENILIDQKGRVKVADFGLAKLLHRTPADYRITLTATGQVMGTIHYMAPEQIERPQTVDHRADLYALGVVFYEMLAGELPLGRFSLPSQKGLADERIDNILIKALEKDPDARYQQAGSIKADLGTGGPSVPMGPLAEQGGLSLQDRLDQEDLRYQVMKPASGLFITAALAVVFWMMLALTFAADERRWWRNGPSHEHLSGDIALACIIGTVLVIAVGSIVVGARRMVRFENHGLVLSTTLLAMLPWSPAVLLGFPFGVAALIVMNRPAVRAAFVRNAVHGRMPRPGSSDSSPRPYSPVRSFVQGMRSLFLRSRIRSKVADPVETWSPRTGQ